ncbi:ABC transporter ATP-binding protein [Pseudoduganella aquatica]|uniref:ATP-binding cassette domain-containing protein n=1 Tax=Pseudoduganella aquatica TaxID=2660641 RepID=A0A7X4HBS2_9BURK|nr:ABC transporter ATP-binding protein [Pseudoduganella aquatica]MYN07999.1 ATP-binding cassette domain-containing protein [Pseudoduganella aquatica]
MNAPISKALLHALPGARPRSRSGGLLIEHVSKSFALKGERLPVLDDISFRVEPGEFVAIVGASGCGKSTLLRLLAGLDTEYEGRLQHDGKDIQGTDLNRGLVFQDHRLFPWLTVEQNIALSFTNTRVPAAERRERVAAEIARVGLDGFADAFPHQLSGGMSQRAAIARALVGKPDVLLLDEPLGALDALTRLRLQQELRRLWQEEGITMLMVTHDIDEAVYLADRIVVLDARPGRIRRVQEVALPHPRQRGQAGFVAIRDSLHADFSF